MEMEENGDILAKCQTWKMYDLGFSQVSSNFHQTLLIIISLGGCNFVGVSLR